jgi:hypothetical protein
MEQMLKARLGFVAACIIQRDNRLSIFSTGTKHKLKDIFALEYYIKLSIVEQKIRIGRK